MIERDKAVEGRSNKPTKQVLDRSDAGVLGSPSGREISPDEISPSGDVIYPGGRPRSAVTDVQDDGAGDTPDGLDPLEEAARHAAEDIPTSSSDKPSDRVPVFDRGDLPPKV